MFSYNCYMIYILTGQPGSGKTTIGKLIVEYLNSKKRNVIQIDGDDLRNIFNNKDYSEIGRRQNIQKSHDIAHFLNAKGFDVVISLVSPYKDLRDDLKIKTNAIEIYLNTTDIRGREHFFVDNYEQPTENYMNLDTSTKSDKESFEYIINKINNDKKY